MCTSDQEMRLFSLIQGDEVNARSPLRKISPKHSALTLQGARLGEVHCRFSALCESYSILSLHKAVGLVSMCRWQALELRTFHSGGTLESVSVNEILLLAFFLV